MKLKPILIVPFIVVLALFSVFGYALLTGVNPQTVPSALTGRALPEFSLSELQDSNVEVQSSELVGEPMLLNIWATWCNACKYEHPVLNNLAANGVKIIGINYKDEREKALVWLDEYADPYAVDVYDPNGDLGFDLGVTGAPETFFVDSNGRIQFRYQGPITTELWENELKAIYDALG